MSKTYVIDIDGTICDWQAGRDYTLAEPFPERIKERSEEHTSELQSPLRTISRTYQRD